MVLELEGEVVAGGAEAQDEIARLGNPLFLVGIVVLEHVMGDGNAHHTALARLQEDFLETFQLFVGPVNRAVDIGDVELYHLAAGPFARVGDGDRGGAMVG